MTPTEQRRQEFEVWARNNLWIEDIGVIYKDFSPKAVWEAWQAAADLYERRGMERARDMCKEHAKAHEHPIIKATALLCADAIERETGK